MGCTIQQLFYFPWCCFSLLMKCPLGEAYYHLSWAPIGGALSTQQKKPDCVPGVLWVNFTADLCVGRIWLQGQAASCREQQTLLSLLSLAEGLAHRADVGWVPGCWAEGPQSTRADLIIGQCVFLACPFLSFSLSHLTSSRQFCELQPLTVESGLQPSLYTNCRKCQGGFSLSQPHICCNQV